MNKASKKYYKAVKLLIPAKGTNEKKFLKIIKNRIIEYNSENDNVTYDELVKHIGSPIELINDYIINTDITYLISKLRKTNIFRKLVYAALAITIVLFILSIQNTISDYKNSVSTNVTKETIIIETID